jgi:Ser-tRNA(Ala) deacylase AlaX
VTKTRILYYDHPYLSQFEATVLSVHDNRDYLNRSAFAPRGGGCPGETGFVGDAQVSDTLMDGEVRISHLVSDPASIVPGLTRRTKKCQAFIDANGARRPMRMTLTVNSGCTGVLVPCGGVHLRDIAEVRDITVSRKSGGKGRHLITTRLASE